MASVCIAEVMMPRFGDRRHRCGAPWKLCLQNSLSRSFHRHTKRNFFLKINALSSQIGNTGKSNDEATMVYPEWKMFSRIAVSMIGLPHSPLAMHLTSGRALATQADDPGQKRERDQTFERDTGVTQSWTFAVVLVTVCSPLIGHEMTSPLFRCTMYRTR